MKKARGFPPSFLLFTTCPKLARTRPGAFFKYSREIELIIKTDIATDGGDRHPGGAQKQLRLTDALVLAPA